MEETTGQAEMRFLGAAAAGGRHSDENKIYLVSYTETHKF
jgi:hypothetical protein